MIALVEGFDTVLFDLDGVIYRGPHALPGVVETTHTLAMQGVRAMYVTNNASRSATTVATHLRDLGLECTPGQVVTSPEAAAQILLAHVPRDAPIYVVGGVGIDDALRDAGLLPTRTIDDPPVAVVQGMGPDVTWRELAQAAYLIESGCLWVATNLDPTFPTEHGIAPGNGSLVAAVATAAGRQPDHVAGKPAPALLRTALARAGSTRAVMVGDRLDTDVLGATRVGIPSLYVATGVHSLLDVCRAAPQMRPTFLGPDVRALLLPGPQAVPVRRTDRVLHWNMDLPPECAWDVATGIAQACWAAADSGYAVDDVGAVERWEAHYPQALPHPA